ncbi:hypothetical protein G6F23_013183 [Rhizopus arrhizus]|nr:hypothetical protein G6F23_013183 [Rhizopus arrhizus]
MDLPHPGAGQWLHAALAAADPGQLSAVPAALRQGDAGATAPWVALCAGHDRAGAGTAALVPLGLELLRVRLRDDPHERAQQLVGVPAAADRAEPAVLWHRVVLRLSVAGHGVDASGVVHCRAGGERGGPEPAARRCPAAVAGRSPAAGDHRRARTHRP